MRSNGNGLSLPAEIVIREHINGGDSGVFMIGGVSVVGAGREIEIVSMRGDVLCTMPVDQIADWVARNNYRYVPRSFGSYQRDAGGRRALSPTNDGIQRR